MCIRDRYVGTYVRFVRTLLKDHPQARIVLTEGGLMTGEKRVALIGYIAETVKRVGDKRVYAIASKPYSGDADDGHPTREQTVNIANDLLPQVRSIMNW